MWGWLFVLLAVLHLYFTPYFPALNNPNENSRVYQVRAFVELHKLSIDEQVERYGMTNDLAKRDGKLYPGKAPGTTFLGVPVYAALRGVLRWMHKPPASPFQILLALRVATSTLPTLLFVLAFRSYLRHQTGDARVANALSIILSAGTLMFPYALLYVNHSTSAACAFGTVIAADAAIDRRRGGRASLRTAGYFAVAGLVASLAAALDYALAPVAAMCLLAVVWWAKPRWQELLSLVAGALVPAVLTGLYHQVCWGSPFRLSMGYLANPVFASNHAQGLFGIVGPTRASTWGVLLSSSKGLFFFCPVAIVGIVSVVAAALVSRRSKHATLTFAIVGWMIAYGVSLVNWDAGWTVGPRYITVAMPFLIWAIAAWWCELGSGGRAALVTVTVGLGIVSILMMVGAGVMFPHLQPGFTNPVLDSIWPLWRDGITPMSAGYWLFGWRGRLDQAPVVVATVVLLGYLVYGAARASAVGRWPWARAAVSVAASLAIALSALMVIRIPRTTDPRVLADGTRFLREFVWEPKLDKPSAPVHQRPPRR